MESDWEHGSCAPVPGAAGPSGFVKLVMKAEQTSDHMSGGTQELHSSCCSKWLTFMALENKNINSENIHRIMEWFGLENTLKII